MSLLSYLDRILTELRQLLGLATVITIILPAAPLSSLAFRELPRRRLQRFRRWDIGRLRCRRGQG